MICGQPKPRGWCFVPGKPIVRGYDSSPLFREDCLERIKQAEKEYAAAEERLRQRKKEFGWID